jgi:cytochrome bd-type quinol oxidase subunit 2
MTQLIAQESKAHAASRFHFARHLVEMFLAMMAGMMVGAFLLATAVGTSVSEVRREHAVAWVVVMAFDMTVPMVAVMLYRGHSLRSAGEMAAAMIVPALPIVACQLSHFGGDVGRAYMPVSMVAMVALIVYRRSEYRAAAASHTLPRRTA